MTLLSELCSVVHLAFAGLSELGGALQLFPLVHQIADLPHQCLMSIDHRLGRCPIGIEPGGGHALLQVPDGPFRFGDPGFEPLDLRAAGALCSRASPWRVR